jgi:phosphoglycerate dehydrogenase-like enzyme
MFRVGVTPDFYVDAKGRFERGLEDEFRGVSQIEVAPLGPQPGKVATPEALNGFDAIFALALKFTAESLRGVERLAVIARWGVGYDMIDVEALTRAGVALAITPQAVRRPVAESIFAFIFALGKNLFGFDRMTRRGRWRGDMNRLTRNFDTQTLGSIGCGNIAREMFQMARAFGFRRLLASDPFVRPADVQSLGIEIVDMETVLRESDFVAVNTFLSKETAGLIGERELKMMKPTAYLINTARGPIVQEAVLARALAEKWIAGAGLDVYEQDPPQPGNPLFELDNVIVTPHALAWTEDLMYDNSVEACRNILAISRGEVPKAIVNREVLASPAFQTKLNRFRSQQ